MTVYVNPYSEGSEAIIYASSINRYKDDLYAAQNSGIDSYNIKASGVTTVALDGASITFSKLSSDALFGIQSFSL